MKKTIKLVLVLLLSNYTFAQSPGALGTANLTGWWKPDGMLTGNVTGWTTSFPTGGSAISLTEAGAPYPQLLTNASNNASNYNKTLDFTANTSVATGVTSPLALSNTTALNLLNNSAVGNTGTFFSSYQLPSGSPTNGHILLYNESLNDAIQFRNLLGVGRLAISKGLGNSLNAVRDYTEDNKRKVISYKGNRSGVATLSVFYDDAQAGAASAASSSSGNLGLYMGWGAGIVGGGVNNSGFRGYINEFIFYNIDLTNAQINKVDTYLAVKYGATLSNAGGGVQGDYTATNNVNVWDASVNPSYHNDVIGLAREDNEALLQKQSHTLDDVTRIYLNTLQTWNGANTATAATFGSDVSYLMVGSTTGNMCATAASNAEVPAGCGLYSRLAREWKVTKTNFTADFSMDVKLSACGAPGSVTVSELRFLVDDDGDFSNGGTTCYYNGDGSGINISYSNPVITVSGISSAMIANGSTSYVTIGSIQSTTPLPIELLNFNAFPVENRNVALEWQTASEHNNDFFTVERSVDLKNWEFVLNQDGAGNSTEMLSYEDVDLQPYMGISYYRLKQTDFDGNFTYSDPRMVELNQQNNEVLVFPNPADDLLYFVTPEDLIIISAQVKDFAGRLVLNESSANSINSLNVAHLSSGVYFVHVALNNGQEQVLRFVVK